eukprot:gene5888-11220_t
MRSKENFFLLLLLTANVIKRLCGTNRKCATSSHRVRRDDLAVLGHHINEETFDATNGRAAYFAGHEIIEFRKPLLYNTFTVEAWIKPEGGQAAVAPILNFVDRCQGEEESIIWILGLKQMQKGHDTRLYFSLKADRLTKLHSVVAHESYRPNIWVHVAAVFNGTSLKLFLNQALVASSHKEFSPVSGFFPSKCGALEVGGDSQKGLFFRGAVDDLRVWKTAKSQREIFQNMRTEILGNDENIVLYEKFEGLQNHGNFDLAFHAVTTSYPEFEPSTLPKDLHQIEVKIPFCGITVCDNPDVVRGYKENSHLRSKKTLRYRLINMANDDGSNPLLSNQEIKRKHQKLNEIFSRYNITWEISIYVVKNSSLRTNSFLFDCKPSKRRMCGKGVPINDFKRLVNLDNRKYLNVFVGKSGDRMHGKATFPWDISVYGVDGGTVLDVDRFGKTKGVNDMVHEFGHNLGLWHVHKGMTDCDDPCFETHASMELGDLCADTNPTPLNERCRDPKHEFCGIKRFRNTPFRNFMGYGDCQDEFTNDQVARMHCYIDLIHHGWVLQDNPSPTPLRPKVLSYSNGLLQMEWVRPLNLGKAFAERNCNKCSPQKKKFHQFAVNAYSPSSSSTWQPEQAVGPPNSERCRIVGTIWMQDVGDSSKEYVIDLSFEKEVIPTGIVVWVTYNGYNAPFDIELLHVDKSVTFVGSAMAQCDIPYTRRIFTKKTTKTVRLRVHDLTGIDAVELISEENHNHCENCPDVKYVVNRKPPFQTGSSVEVAIPRFIDRQIKDEAISYEYRIQTVVGSHVSLPSLPLKFQPKAGFCGDGIIQKLSGEQCDDGNLRSGDGCSIECKHEDVFKCKGQPSLCYKYEGDGVCEDFERQISAVDCGFYVPQGFEQQWATSAMTNPRYDCKPTNGAMTGHPPPDLKCHHTQPVDKTAYVCAEAENQGDFWIRFGFAEPVVATSVVLYLQSDGKWTGKKKSYIKVELIDTENKLRSIGVENFTVTCKQHPMVLPVLHDMTRPFFRTKAVHISFPVYRRVIISGVALRTSKILNPVAASSCDVAKKELYNPRIHSCHPYKCHVPTCKPLIIKKAEVKCEGVNDGDTCKVTCFNGYYPRKAVAVKCILGKWNVNAIKCLPVDCGLIKIKRAILECKQDTTFKSMCTFHCVNRAHMVGDDNKIICMEDGLWSARKASCEYYCPAPPLVENSHSLDYKCDARHANVRQQNEMGTVCRYQCMPGYVLDSLNSKAVGVLSRLTCNENGIWTQDSKCVPVKCKELSEFAKLVYNCTKANEFGSICRTVCSQTNETHEVVCQVNGHWSTNFNYCQYEGHCDAISSTNDIAYKSCAHHVGGSCQPLCISQGYDAAFKVGMEEKHDIKLYCLPNRTWYPSPGQIYCVKSCMKSYRGDSICDCSNNNKHCNYDDGDCCEQTVKKKKVEFIGSYRCICRDPKKLSSFQPTLSKLSSLQTEDVLST